MKKTIFTTIALFALMALPVQAKRLKYVFYFISDGTGVNIVQAGEHYRAHLAGTEGFGTVPYSFSEFPVVGMATTYSASSRVTDSSASGTALASGVKTINGYLGVRTDGVTPVQPICYYAHQLGMRVGVATSVSVDHATPASFYAHAKSRNDYHEIGHQLINTDYVDFFGGGGFNNPTHKDHPGEASLYELAEQSGMAVAYGYDDYKAKAAAAKRMLLVQTKDELAINGGSVPYAIDRTPSSLTIEDILRAEIDFLMKDNPKRGFFLMNEIGGRVDWSDHSNDAAASFAELEAVDRCVQIALDFYRQHPDETLIILTSDHDTGGPSIGAGNYEMHPKVLQYQTISKDKLSADIHALRDKRGENYVTWEEAKELLTKSFGFWKSVNVTEQEERMLYAAYEKSFRPNVNRATERGLYSENEQLSVVATRIINRKADVAWAHGSHTGGLVPVYAIGKGAEEFCSMNDNAEIPRILARLMGTEIKN